MFRIDRKKPSVAKGLLSGVVAGLVASFVMNRFQEIRERWSRLREEEGKDARREREGQSPQTQKAAEGGGENPTVKTAEKVAEGVFGHRLDTEEKKLAGPAVHYAYGTAVGALYGAVADVWPEAAKGAGLPFGAAVWLGGDEVALRVLKLSKKPTEYTLSTHVYALASHIVYGATTELVRRMVRNAI